MKTGHGPTEDAGGATRNEENVIRLPRDWLGPREELVPIGPASHARAAQLETDAPPPAADAFWSEDAAALHDAVQAPRETHRLPTSPPVRLVAPVAGQWRFRLPGAPRWADLGGLRQVRIRWALLAVPAVALLVLAAIGYSEQGSPGVTTTRTGSSSGADPSASTPLSKTALVAAAESRLAAAGVSSRHGAPRVARARARTPAHTGARPRRSPASARARNHVSRAHHSSPVPAPVVTHASSPPPTSSSTPSAGTTSHSTSAPVTVTTPVSETASKPNSGGSSSAPRPGPTGIGTMSGGCTVKCS